ncbi:MAG: NAD(+)/NADH kinase [Candidatus Accumulibacter sp.]|jgi:NAD+ kinase|nr:NAD(+)/NADH kinase [Accumulibacter sp.]
MKTDDALISAPSIPLRIPPKTIALIGKYRSHDLSGLLATLARPLHKQGVAVLIEKATASNFDASTPPPCWEVCDFSEIGARADLAIVLGGDGTMLHTARKLAPYRVPLVGVNQGRLGFMTDIARDDLLSSVDSLLHGDFLPEERMLLEAKIVRDGEAIASGLALNEIVVDKGGISRLIEFELFVDGVFVYGLHADGLIISTPTGSTAYSLSANGPIMHPQISGVALVPLCPHSLTNRSLLVGDRNEIEIRLIRSIDARAHFVGQVRVDLRVRDTLRIRRADVSACFLHPPGYNYFAMLREKLHWNEESERFPRAREGAGKPRAKAMGRRSRFPRAREGAD